MERIKENLELRKEQNLMSFVLMLCFLMIAFSFWGAFSSDRVAAENTEEMNRVVASQTK